MQDDTSSGESQPANEEIQIVDLYTDGACSGNPGPGGWGCVLLYKGVSKKIRGNCQATTNNRMEILAAVNGLKSITRSDVKIRVFTDSKYVKNGITEWVSSWRSKGWKTASGKPVKNIELWKELDELSSGMSVEWNWVKAHSDNSYNNLADSLARGAVSELRSGKYLEFEDLSSTA